MDTKKLLQRNLDGKKIGLLGGSFNPAHDAHVEMSLFAHARLKLDEVWWLVSPQNPLKSQENMASLQGRLACAQALAAPHKSILVTSLEAHWNVRFTVDTVRSIKMHWPHAHFVLLMGEDNFGQLNQWRLWQEIFLQLPIAVFRRSGYVDSCQQGGARDLFASAELPLTSAEDLAVSPPPAWVVLDNRLNPLSATQIRERSKPTCRRSTTMVVKKKPAAKKTVKKVAKKPAAKKTVKKAVKKAVKKVVKKVAKKPAAKKKTAKKK